MHDPTPPTLDAVYEHLSAGGHVRRLLELARDEDLGPSAHSAAAGAGAGDITSLATIEGSASGNASLVARQGGVIAGLRFIPDLLDAFGVRGAVEATIIAADGCSVGPGTAVAALRGRLRDLLAIERTLLNLVGRLSGVATRTAAFVHLTRGTRARILDTRKTTPGLRAFEKYAVRCGGGHSHRLGLYDAVLIKDNHLAGVPIDRVAGVVSAGAERARAIARERGVELSFIECEVDRLDQLRAVLDSGGCGVDIVLLDNMPVDSLREAVRLRDSKFPRILLEASGGVSEHTVRAIAETGIDRISIGGLTHQAVSLDVAFDMT